MDKFKEMRIVLDEETHAGFKATASANKKSMRQVMLDLIDKYIKRGK